MPIILQNGVRSVAASVPQEDHPTENTVAVVITGGTLPWVLKFWARLGTHRAYLGGVRLHATNFARVAAIVSCPNARAFEVQGQATDPAAQDALQVHFEGLDARGGPWGVQPVPGVSVAYARSYRVLTGAAGVVQVVGEVYGWAARASAAGATVAAAAGPGLAFGPIAVPVNGSVQGNCMGAMAPVSTWTFVGTDGYLIEYFPPLGEFDG
jgi:hypothetical protein